MGNRYLKTIGIVGAFFMASLSFGQQKQQPVPNFVNPFQSKSSNFKGNVIAPTNNNATVNIQQPKPKIEIVNGSFSVNLEKDRLTKENAVTQMPIWFNLSENHTFQRVSERTDELGIMHTNFQQYYNGFLVEGQLIMLHSKNGKLTSINGQVAQFENIETIQTINNEQALTTAKSYLKVTELINNYPIETVITIIPSEKGTNTKLAQKVRIDSYSPFVMCNVYIDAQSGSVLNKINLIAHADVPGTAQTLYSGNHSITCDSHNGAFRLRESGRNIHTYNATSATGLTTSGFTGSTDFVSSSTNFQGVPRITSFTISAVAQSWWYTVFADEIPDLYIKVKDGSNQTVYTSNYVNNTFPPFTITNLNIYLNNPPYTVEIWDYDAVGGDDFGGSYTIVSNVGTQNWSGSGNNGSYVISSGGHPALDVHWGMEKTYDFFSTILNRNSYDGNGSLIKQYINSPMTQSNQGGDPNNAFAMGSPYNIMVYGLGDGITMNPVVGLDVAGHEFTHLVVNNNGNGGLVYQGESGALNESFADIFGVCVEFFSGVNPDWLIGEDVMVNAPFLRSMSNPNATQNPDTYNGQYWANPSNLNFDHGGVHINSGVQNFWFYLLSQGGSGTNDLGNAYSVTGIGIAQARQIAYKNLITYLGPNATYIDAYNGSLQAAQDLYGNPSTQYTAVRQAWYAVGIGNDPNNFCSGTTNLTAPSGTITDGSGSANYNNNANCKWVIAPAGATQIQLTFTAFDTEANYDTVFVYNGPDDTFPLLATWWGNTLPPVINTTAGIGAMCVKFKSDNTVTAGGWSANYQAYGTAPSCSGGTILSTPTGTFNDGSGGSNYGNNQQCYWFISPPCATSVTLSFSQFNTELNYDGVVIYNGWDNNATQLAVYTGTSIPSSVTSNTGKMLVVFLSDYSATMQGFTANYTSTGSAYCSGVTNLNTADNGTFSDGSGSNNYCNNLDCRWLIQPPQATTVTLNFTAFDLEDASPDGQTIYDAIEIYNGTTTAAPLLGRYTGTNLPPAITSTGGSMLVRFISDIEVTKQGFTANYTSTQNPYCSGTTTNLTAQSGTFADGSASNNYANNTSCSWLIQPTNASAITLSFSAFNTELNNDGVIVYDGANNTAPVLGQFSGTSIPSSVTSTGGSMYVEFLSNPSVRGQGWTANYTSTIAPNAPVANFSATNTNFCENTCINFMDNSTNSPTSWNWSFPGGNPSSSNVQNPSNICYNTAGTYNVVLTSSNSGGSNTITMNGYITVNPQPTVPAITASPSNIVCQGQTITLNVSNPCSGCNYTWSPSSQTGTSIAVTSSNNYSVSAVNSCGQVSSSPINITVNSLPPTPTITVNGNELTSSSASGNQWYLDGSLIGGANQQTFIAQQSGNYHVVVTDGNNCSSQSSSVSVLVTGINDLETKSFVAVYPNPTIGNVNIQFSNEQKNVAVEIFDVAGKLVMKHALNNVSQNHVYTFSIAGLPNGVYQLRLNANGNFNYHRLVLTK